MQYSVVNYKNVRSITENFRFDADYFKPKYLKEDKQRTHFRNIPIGDFCYVTDGQHGYHEVDKSSPIFHLTAKNAKGWFANTEGADRLAQWVDDKNKRSSLKERDLILSTRGTVGLCALVMKEALPANIDQDVARIAINAKAEIEPEFLLAYLNCEFGQDWLIRNSSGMVQQGIPLDKVRGIPVPLLSSGFQKYCKQIIEAGYKSLRDSKMLYLQTERAILSELGLANWKPKHHLSFIKNFSDTQASDRIDAEYFQPMYEQVEAILSKRNRKSLESICSLINYGTVPTSPYIEKGSPYVKGLNLIDGLVQGDFDFLENTQNLPRKFYTKEHDIIISQMGTVGKAGLVSKDQANWLFASFTIRIRLKNTDFINPYVLTLYINRIAREWYLMRKIAQASVRQNTDLPTIRNLQVPEIANNIQNGITSQIIQSHELKSKSKHFLEIAKHGVEMAIEKNEKDAQNWINAELKKLGIKQLTTT